MFEFVMYCFVAFRFFWGEVNLDVFEFEVFEVSQVLFSLTFEIIVT